MYVTYNFDKTYRIEFCYHTDNQGRKITQCNFWKVEGDTEILTSVGRAVCAKGDNFSKVIGRKIALTSALENQDKTLRTAVWDKYKATSRYVA